MRRWFLVAALLVSACSSGPTSEKAERLAAKAADAWERSDFDEAQRLLTSAKAELAKPFNECADALRAQSLATSINGFAEAVHLRSSPDSVERAVSLLAARNAVGEVVSRPGGCEFQQLPPTETERRIQSIVQATSLKACDVLAARGPDSDLLFSAVTGKLTVACATSSKALAADPGRYEQVQNAQRDRRDIGLLYCSQFETGARWPQAEYQRDIQRFGMPKSVRFTRDGFEASWPEGYRLSVLGNPNLVRRTLTDRSYADVVRTHGQVGDVLLASIKENGRAEAVDDIERRYCLTAGELSHVVGVPVRGSAEEALDDLACSDLSEQACTALKKMARSRGATVSELRDENAGYGYTADDLAELRKMGMSPAEARAAEAVICMENGDC